MMQSCEPNETLIERLTHVYWLGGSPCSGKSSIARALVERFGFQYYVCDDAFYLHNEIVTPEKQPTFYRVMHLSIEDLWMRPVEQQTADELEVYREEFPLILADLLALPKTRPILAEGAALLPECVAPLAVEPRRAIWVVPAAEFQLYHYSQREWAKNYVKECSDPRQAFQNWMERDICFARYVREDAERRGFRALVVDGNYSIEENTELVARHFNLGK